ncbi:hypothetical protein M8J74_41370, partial [Streptomyces panaciradicis]|nr:hypothetical protein [Streptomyces panaciradicis]
GGEMPGGGQAVPGGGSGTGQAPGGTGELGDTAPGGTAPGATGEAGQRGGMGGGPGGMGGADSELIAYLKKHRDGARWLLAVSNSQSSAQIELSAREPVISMWGFTGSDNAMTVARLKELVKKGELHYVQIGGGMGGGMGGPGGGNSVSTEVSNWVKKHGTAVKESAYSRSSASSSTSATSGTNSSSLYRLDPSDVG